MTSHPKTHRNPGILALLVGLLACSLATAVQPQGIVYESEAISSPDGAWELNKRSGAKWMLWTTEQDIEAKRSGGAVLAGPSVAEERATPEEGAPPLHSVVTDLEPGTYLVYVSNPGRPLAYSQDGKEWFKHAGSELALGAHNLAEGRFELWVDDRYPHPPGNPGPGYYDYVRFVPVPKSALNVERFAPSRTLRRQLEEDDLAFVVPAVETSDWVGFEQEGDCIKGTSPGHRFTYTFEREGAFYLAVSMVDDVDGIEQLKATLNDKQIGCIVADAAASEALFSFKEPLEIKTGDTLTFTCETPVGCYRIKKLYFASSFIKPPPPAFRSVEVYSPRPGVADICWTTDGIVPTGSVEYGLAEPFQRSEPETYEGRNHRVRLSGLDAAREHRARIVTEYEGREIHSDDFSLTPTPSETAKSKPLLVKIAVPEPTDRRRSHWPATIGMPFARGAVARVEDLRLATPNGEATPLQAECFSKWPDGSVKWATLSWFADSTFADQDAAYSLRCEPEPSEKGTIPGTFLRLQVDDEAWRINTGALAFDIGKHVPALFNRVGLDLNGDGAIAGDERIEMEPLGANLKLETGDRTFLTCGPPDTDSFEVESSGHVRAIVKWSGPLVDREGNTAWSYLIRVTLWKGLPVMGVNVSVCNDQPEPTFRPVTALALRVPLDGEGGVFGGFDGAALETVPDEDGLWIHQDKDNRYSVRTAAGLTQGERSSGIAVAEDDDARITVLMRDFWQTYPSGYAIKPDGVHVRLLPELAPDTYDGEEEAPWFYKLYAWCRDGEYMFRAGQLTQHEVFVHYGPPGTDTSDIAQWLAHPLLPQAPPEYLCATGALSRPLFPRTPGLWDDYERFFDLSFAHNLADRERRRTYGWMHFGDWHGERSCNYGNNEYSMDWALGMQWMRTGDPACFDRGLEMARHYSTVDTIHGAFTEHRNGLVWTHSFNHNGTALSLEDLTVPQDDKGMQAYIERYGGGMFKGAMDRQGHVFEPGMWLYAALTGDPWLRDTARRVCDNQARKLTPAFNFGIERSGGWPLINACAAYNFSGNPYYLNAARIMVERCLERQDPETGGWLHTPPRSETDNVPVLGGKAFAVGILSHGLLRYLDIEPQDRQDVRHMLVRGADWLMNEAWCPGKGFRYISNCPKYQDSGYRGMTCALNAEIIAFAHEETGDPKYLEFWKEMMIDLWEKPYSGIGKGFTQATRQSVFGLDRVLPYGIKSAKGLASQEE